MSTKTLDDHIEVTPGVSGGKARIAGHRITVQDIVIWCDRLGASVDEIAAEHDLTQSDVHAALAYYFDHRAEIDKSLKDREALVEALRLRTPSKIRREPRRPKSDGAAC